MSFKSQIIFDSIKHFNFQDHYNFIIEHYFEYLNPLDEFLIFHFLFLCFKIIHLFNKLELIDLAYFTIALNFQIVNIEPNH